MKHKVLFAVIVPASLSLGGCAVSIGDKVELPATVPATSMLEVKFQEIEAPTGQIMLSLFDNQIAHDQNGAPVRGATVRVSGSAATARFEGLAPGTYAVKAFHDVDGDGKMATNPFGLPIEPFAFSNDAVAEGGPAKWAKTQFTVAPGANTITITIK